MSTIDARERIRTSATDEGGGWWSVLGSVLALLTAIAMISAMVISMRLGGWAAEAQLATEQLTTAALDAARTGSPLPSAPAALELPSLLELLTGQPRP